jgi:SAM-dependent methyltransferase
MPSARFDRSVAIRYDHARELDPATLDLWLEAIRSSLPSDFQPTTIVDLGCGTGRFTRPLATFYDCRVIGVDPSEAMLAVAAAEAAANVEWRLGSGDHLPLDDGTAELVFLSQVFHHFAEPATALSEVHRALGPGGFLVVRNSSLETLQRIRWLRYFPEAMQVERARIPRRDTIARIIGVQGFELVGQRTVEQVFARSPTEYAEKVSGRGLSSLFMIDDKAFEEGMGRLRGWAASRPAEEPVLEPVELYTFVKMDRGP